ncbi:hypothetical protein [Yoonia vestfoldensis]|uniref:Uncharacterized protein n=1 Tax=Yoonia vestfoldensis TaxID=245188 RepID=A0A1Y0EDK8_9RHOB|nr:hypothetical protein [Yoonia vestfoldensis]ARU01716.1 hypothetical protein LOKVESSMR4R_02412 [Yoonia vestfoldensis]
MDIAASVDRLISTLETFKASTPTVPNSQQRSEFDALFSDALSKLDQPNVVPVAVNAADIDNAPVTFQPNAVSFAAFQAADWLVDSQSDATAARPNMKEFMDATGASAANASELLYGVIGSNADLRDWSKIMSSGNPIDAARAATRQLYNSDKEYALVNHADYGTVRFVDTLAESSLSSKTVLSRSGNFADIATGADTRTTMAVSSTGLLLRGAGSTQEQIERTAWLFGFDAPEAAA